MAATDDDLSEFEKDALISNMMKEKAKITCDSAVKDRAGYAMLMSPNKDETAVHGCHCRGDMVVHMSKAFPLPFSRLWQHPLPKLPMSLGPCQDPVIGLDPSSSSDEN
ncbi:unnamed protein product, partial [Porites evermanni]